MLALANVFQVHFFFRLAMCVAELYSSVLCLD